MFRKGEKVDGKEMYGLQADEIVKTARLRADSKTKASRWMLDVVVVSLVLCCLLPALKVQCQWSGTWRTAGKGTVEVLGAGPDGD